MNFDILDTLLSIPGILVGLSFHEYAHAQAAVWLGDDTPKYQGRLTINPIAHIDPMGFLCLMIARFGWAKPVMINPSNFKNKRRDDILVALAGPAMNILMAIIFLLIIKGVSYIPVGILSDEMYPIVFKVLNYTVVINIVLCVFNLIPIPPLDGNHIFFGLLGLKETRFYYQIASKGSFILLLLIITDRYTNILETIILTPVSMIYSTLVGLVLL